MLIKVQQTVCMCDVTTRLVGDILRSAATREKKVHKKVISLVLLQNHEVCKLSAKAECSHISLNVSWGDVSPSSLYRSKLCNHILRPCFSLLNIKQSDNNTERHCCMVVLRSPQVKQLTRDKCERDVEYGDNAITK